MARLCSRKSRFGKCHPPPRRPNQRFITRTSAVREVVKRYRPRLSNRSVRGSCRGPRPTIGGPTPIPRWWRGITPIFLTPMSIVLVPGCSVNLSRAGCGGCRSDSWHHLLRIRPRLYVGPGDMRHAGGLWCRLCRRSAAGSRCQNISSQPPRSCLARRVGLPKGGPRLAYAVRLDNGKRADRLIAMLRKLPPALGASMILIGEGKLCDSLAVAACGLPVALPGYCAVPHPAADCQPTRGLNSKRGTPRRTPFAFQVVRPVCQAFTMVFTSMKSFRPWRPPSRPLPDCL